METILFFALIGLYWGGLLGMGLLTLGGVVHVIGGSYALLTGTAASVPPPGVAASSGSIPDKFIDELAVKMRTLKAAGVVDKQVFKRILLNTFHKNRYWKDFMKNGQGVPMIEIATERFCNGRNT